MDSVKEKEKENKALRKKLAEQKHEHAEEQAREIKGVAVLSQKMEGLNNLELRELADSLKQKLGSGVVILGTTHEQKIYLVASITKDLTKRIKANELMQELAQIFDGGGGGRSDFAQAGGTKTELLDKVIEQSFSVVKKMLS